MEGETTADCGGSWNFRIELDLVSKYIQFRCWWRPGTQVDDCLHRANGGRVYGAAVHVVVVKSKGKLQPFIVELVQLRGLGSYFGEDLCIARVVKDGCADVRKDHKWQ